MAKKTNAPEIPFYRYLHYYYQTNRGMIRNNYKQLTKKFLDFNDPSNAGAFLRRPQFEALEMYVFLKEYLDNRHLYELFNDWYNTTGVFEGRKSYSVGEKEQGSLFEEYSLDQYKEVFKEYEAVKQVYPNYIFALTMGTGKTLLMATSIFYEFLLANKFPKEKAYCHNALIFAPDKTVLQSLKEIITFDKSKVIPPEYRNWIETNVKFHFLDDTGTTLTTMDKSDFNIIISNTQKVILKRKNKTDNATGKLFHGDADRYRAIQANKDYEDLLQLEVDNEESLTSNQRFSKLIRLPQLGIYVDEAHHAFGSQLENDMLGRTETSLRKTINQLALNLDQAGTHVVACYNYTGTPYVKDRLLPEVVYACGLNEAIKSRYLKKVMVTGYTNSKTQDFIKITINDFWEKYGSARYEGMLPKIAFFASTIEELEKELRPAVEKVLTKLDIPHDKILVNVGDAKLTTNDDIREFINLDRPDSNKQFILLVNKGKEGWNCRSLFGVGLYRQPKSKIFVLQATMRCLRSITEAQQTGRVYLSEDNMKILEDELQENFRLTIEDLNKTSQESQSVQVRPVEPPRKVKFKRISKLYKVIEKKNPVKDGLNYSTIDPERYKIKGTTKSLEDIKTTKGETKDYTVTKENTEYSAYTLIAEITRYFNKSPVDVDAYLSSLPGGIEELLVKVNQYNEIIYDWLVPELFKRFYELKEYKEEEEHEVELVKKPAGKDYYEITAKPELTCRINDSAYIDYKTKSFHLDHYCFDSKPEKELFWKLLQDDKIKEVYFTGMLTHGQSDFYISYVDPISHTLRSYFPDFLVMNEDGSYTIMEVKADYMVDDAVVKAKAEYARIHAAASGMEYRMVKASEVGK